MSIKQRKAVVLLSGGQDSTTCFHWARGLFDEIHAVSFRYGQRHESELDYAIEIADKYEVPHTVVPLPHLGNLSVSALTDQNLDVNDPHPFKHGLPASYVPNRNMTFLTVAHIIAQNTGADAIVGGMCQTDYSGYPDCRQDFIDLAQQTLNAGSESGIEIITPLMYMDKAATWDLVYSLGEEALRDVWNSRTCYNGVTDKLNDWGPGCGECPACELRAKGYTERMKRDELDSGYLRALLAPNDQPD